MVVEHLRGRAVVSLHQAEKLGSVDDVLVDIKDHRLAGITIGGGLFRGDSSIAWSNIRSIGQDAVMVDVQSAAEYRAAEGVVPLSNLRGRKVVTAGGELAGTIESLDFDTETGTVNYYLVAGLSTSRFRTAPQYQLPPVAIKAIGDDIITVDESGIDFQRLQNPS
ncbi:MAG: PRC-barrel domain protein [Chloroflexi bacterium]|nr:PRC-barrel domain protein [Chloroflexota bacterium]